MPNGDRVVGGSASSPSRPVRCHGASPASSGRSSRCRTGAP